MGGFDRVSVGFPGVVRGGRVLTAPNLGTAEWRGHDLARALAARWGRPVRMLNDATVHGLGVIAGRGVELVVTLGTGFGFALYWDGRVGPQVEVGEPADPVGGEPGAQGPPTHGGGRSSEHGRVERAGVVHTPSCAFLPGELRVCAR